MSIELDTNIKKYYIERTKESLKRLERVFGHPVKMHISRHRKKSFKGCRSHLHIDESW